MQDPILEEIWRVREELLKKYGGLHGYFEHLQALDRARLRRKKQQKAGKKTGRNERAVTRRIGSARGHRR